MKNKKNLQCKIAVMVIGFFLCSIAHARLNINTNLDSSSLSQITKKSKSITESKISDTDSPNISTSASTTTAQSSALGQPSSNTRKINVDKELKEITSNAGKLDDTGLLGGASNTGTPNDLPTPNELASAADKKQIQMTKIDSPISSK